MPLPIESHNLTKNFQTVRRIIFYFFFFRIYLGEFQFLDAENALLHQEGFGKCFINYSESPYFVISEAENRTK